MTLLNQLVHAGELIKDNKLAEARSILKQILAVDKQNITAWILYGDTISDKQVALQYYKKALAIDPNYAPALERYQKIKLDMANQVISAKQDPTLAKYGLGKLVAKTRPNLIPSIFASLGLVLSILLLWQNVTTSQLASTQNSTFFCFAPIFLLCSTILIDRYFDEITIWENGIIEKHLLYKKVWRWSDFINYDLQHHTMRYIRFVRFNKYIKIDKSIKVTLFSEKGNFVLSKRFTNHMVLGYYIIDCQVHNGNPRYDFPTYMRNRNKIDTSKDWHR